MMELRVKQRGGLDVARRRPCSEPLWIGRKARRDRRSKRQSQSLAAEPACAWRRLGAAGQSLLDQRTRRPAREATAAAPSQRQGRAQELPDAGAPDLFARDGGAFSGWL